MTLFAALDIETTGLDQENDVVLEVAWAITDTEFNQLTPIRTHIVSHEIHGWQEAWRLLQANDYVRDMHQRSGLAADLTTKRSWSMESMVLQFRDDVNVAGLAADTGNRLSEEDVHLTGLSIGFDREFLKRDKSWGLLFDNDALGMTIHHRLLDLSSVKLMLDSAGVPWEKAPNLGAHRAANDVQEVIDQGKIFRSIFDEVKI